MFLQQFPIASSQPCLPSPLTPSIQRFVRNKDSTDNSLVLCKCFCCSNLLQTFNHDIMHICIYVFLYVYINICHPPKDLLRGVPYMYACPLSFGILGIIMLGANRLPGGCPGCPGTLGSLQIYLEIWRKTSWKDGFSFHHKQRLAQGTSARDIRWSFHHDLASSWDVNEPQL